MRSVFELYSIKVLITNSSYYLHKRKITNNYLIYKRGIRYKSDILGPVPLKNKLMSPASKLGKIKDPNETENFVVSIKDLNTKDHIIENTKSVNTPKTTTGLDKILEDTCSIRSDEGIWSTMDINNDKQTIEDIKSIDDISIGKDINYPSADDISIGRDINYPSADDIYTSTEPICTIKDSLDSSFIDDESNIVDCLDLDITIDTIPNDLNIVSKILTKIEQLTKALEDGNEFFLDLTDIWIYICILYFFLLILFMLILGILSAIKDIWFKSQYKYITRLKNTINLAWLEKAIHYQASEYAWYVDHQLKFMNSRLKEFDIFNKYTKHITDTVNYMLDFLKKANKNGIILGDPLSNKAASFNTNITAYIDFAPIIHDINQEFTYDVSPIYPPNRTDSAYRNVDYLWNDIGKQDHKYNTSHKYYDKLIRFLRSNCNNRPNATSSNKTYFVDWNTISQRIKDKFTYYAQELNIEITHPTVNVGNAGYGGNLTEILLMSDSVHFRVNETELMANMSSIFHHYFNFDSDQRGRWKIAAQYREPESNLEPDFVILGRHLGLEIAKLVVEIKTYGGDSFEKMLEQITNSSRFSVGIGGGEFTEEFDANTRTLKFTGASQFVILIRGTQIAFLERYSYQLSSVGLDGRDCIVPLTMPVNTTKGIENPVLVDIMSRHRHLCDKKKPFPYDEEADNDLGKYYVFDLITDHDACHELFRYVSSELPRLHSIE